jgi:hypothetical protein
VIDIEQSCLCAFEQNRPTRGGGLVQKMTGVGNEGRQAFKYGRGFSNDGFRVEPLATVRFDDPVGIFQIAFNSRAQHFRHQRIRDANAAASRLVFVRWPDAPQRRADFFVAETFLAGVIERAVIGKNQMCARTDLHPFGRDLNALR